MRFKQASPAKVLEAVRLQYSVFTYYASALSSFELALSVPPTYCKRNYNKETLYRLFECLLYRDFAEEYATKLVKLDIVLTDQLTTRTIYP